MGRWRGQCKIHSFRKLKAMLYTKDFVFLAFPKTGSSFMRRQVKNRGEALRIRHIFLPSLFWPRDFFFEQQVRRISPVGIEQHGNRRQISEIATFNSVHKSFIVAARLTFFKLTGKRRIVSIYRDPIDRLLSSYRFQWYSTWDGNLRKEAEMMYPGFPDWSLTDMYNYHTVIVSRKLKSLFSKFEESDLKIGTESWRFILFFMSRNLLRSWKRSWPGSEEDLLEMFLIDTKDIHFLTQERLTEELNVLLEVAAFGEDKKSPDSELKVNVTRQHHRFKSSHDVTKEEIEKIREKESFLYAYAERRGLK